MEGESEYSFWHLLVRDVAYRQIPRAERARRTARPPPGSSARPASGSRTSPRCSHTTTCRRSSSRRPPGDTDQAEELAAPARRFLALAGERALGLDTAQAEARLARALELTPADDPERPELLVRWADAAFQAGRPREAAEALERGARRRSVPAATRRPPHGRSSSARASHSASATARRWSRSPPRRSTLLEPESARAGARRRLRAARERARHRRRLRGGDRGRRPCARARRDARPAGARARARLPRLRSHLPRRRGRPRRDGAGARPARRAGRRKGRRHPSEQSRPRPLSAPGAGPLARRLRAGDRLLRTARPRRAGGACSRPTAPTCWQSSAGPSEALERVGRLAAALEAQRRGAR